MMVKDLARSMSASIHMSELRPRIVVAEFDVSVPKHAVKAYQVMQLVAGVDVRNSQLQVISLSPEKDDSSKDCEY
jgi:hypothetical protein